MPRVNKSLICESGKSNNFNWDKHIFSPNVRQAS